MKSLNRAYDQYEQNLEFIKKQQKIDQLKNWIKNIDRAASIELYSEHCDNEKINKFKNLRAEIVKMLNILE